MSKHRSNNDNPLTPESLIEILNEYKNKISAIIYVHNKNTPNVYGRLVQTGILTIDVSKHLISKRKGNDKELIRKLKFIHPQHSASETGIKLAKSRKKETVKIDKTIEETFIKIHVKKLKKHIQLCWNKNHKKGGETNQRPKN